VRAPHPRGADGAARSRRGSGPTERRRGPAPSRLALWVPALYAAASVAWIAVSDAFLAAAFPSVQDMAWWSTAKGIGFVAVTTAALHAVLRWATRRERRAARRYDLLAEHTRDVILFIRRADGRILDANAAAVAAYGWSREELLRMTVLDLRVPGSAGLAAAQMAEADAGSVRSTPCTGARTERPSPWT